MKIIDRIFEYLDYKHIKPTAFEKKIGLSNGYLGVQKKREADIGEGIILKLIDNCKDLSIDWLITGKGAMLKEESQTAIQKAADEFKGQTQRLENVGNRVLGAREQPGPASTENEAWLRSIIESQQRQLESQQETIKVQAVTIEKLTLKGAAVDVPDVVSRAASE